VAARKQGSPPGSPWKSGHGRRSGTPRRQCARPPAPSPHCRLHQIGIIQTMSAKRPDPLLRVGAPFSARARQYGSESARFVDASTA